MFEKDFNLDRLSPDQKNILKQLLMKISAVFSKSMKSLDHTDLVEPHRDFKSELPVRTLPFRRPQSIQEHAKEQISQLVDTNFIEKNSVNGHIPC